MPGKEYLIQFLPFQVNPSHHYYLFVKAFFKECLDTGLLCAFNCSPDVACSNARTRAVIKPCPHANAYSTASYCSFNTTEYFNSRFQLTPPSLLYASLGNLAGKGVISAQAFEGIIPMLKAGLNQSVHSDPAGLTEIDRMLHRMTTYVKDLSGSRTEPIK